MVSKPVVFISSTSDLRVARELVGKVLYSMGYEPVWQDIEAVAGGELLHVLRNRIEPCTVMIQLVGQRYGAEPPNPSTEFGRVSYTQFEALYAEQLGRKVIYHFIDPAFPIEPSSVESDDRQRLQADYRQRIKDANKLRQTNITSTQDLELSIRRISDELAAVRRQSDARFLRMLWLSGGAVAAIMIVAALVVGGFHLVRSKQGEQTEQAADLKKQVDRIEQSLIAEKQASGGAPVLSAADRAILEEAKTQGDLKSRASASVLAPDANTDTLLAQLKAQQAGQAFDLAMLEGKRWFFDKGGQEDKAVPFFEQAMELRADSLEARSFAAHAHSDARIGSIAAHQQRAIDICGETLKLVLPNSLEWAETQNILGNAWHRLPTGDQARNVQTAIDCYTQALKVRTRKDFPREWAATQVDLGSSWQKLPTGDPATNLQNAIGCYTQAMEIFIRVDSPAAWALIQNNLGGAWTDLPVGDRAKNLQTAIDCFTLALEVRTRDERPIEWAETQNNLGNAWQTLPTGDRAKNIQLAIDCYTKCLEVYTRAEFPINWARTQYNLANAWYRRPTGDYATNLQNAIDCYTRALQVRTRAEFPTEWAATQKNFSLALATLASEPGQDPCSLLRRGIASCKAALTVYTSDAFPRDHASSIRLLGLERNQYEASPCAAEVPFDAIAPAK